MMPTPMSVVGPAKVGAGALSALSKGVRAAKVTEEVVRTERALEAGETLIELSSGGRTARYMKDALGRPIEAEMEANVRQLGRAKGYRPDPIGGLVRGEHRGHMIPEGTAANPRLVNVQENLISEAAASNLGPKKSFDNLLARMKAENPSSSVLSRHRSLYRDDALRPYAVEHQIVKDDEVVYRVTIENK
jgi:hypothetical protein